MECKGVRVRSLISQHIVLNSKESVRKFPGEIICVINDVIKWCNIASIWID